jgi:hypothetical protein
MGWERRGAGGPVPGTPVVPGSIAAVKRIPAGLVAVALVLATGVATSACTVGPTAASVNPDTISMSSLNAELDGLTATTAGQCLLSLNFPQALDLTGVGSGGTGTYSTDFANLVLGNDIDNLLASQFLADHQIHITTSELNQAEGNFATLIDGAIAAQTQQAAAVGGTGGCLKANGSPYTGKTLLAALSAGIRHTELVNQAVEESLLARGADLSDAAVLTYYTANPTQFVKDCVSAIQTTDQATASSAYSKLKAGTPFAQVAAAATADPAAAAQSGEVGCFSEATVLSQLQVPSVAEGQPVGPVQSNGSWLVYVVTSRTTIPILQAAPTIRQVLLRATANRQRVSKEVLTFARSASVEVNPQYGTWTGTQITPPASPAKRFLLPLYGSSVTVPSSTTTTPSTLAPASASSTSSTAGSTSSTTSGSTGG